MPHGWGVNSKGLVRKLMCSAILLVSKDECTAYQLSLDLSHKNLKVRATL